MRGVKFIRPADPSMVALHCTGNQVCPQRPSLSTETKLSLHATGVRLLGVHPSPRLVKPGEAPCSLSTYDVLVATDGELIRRAGARGVCYLMFSYGAQLQTRWDAVPWMSLCGLQSRHQW